MSTKEHRDRTGHLCNCCYKDNPCIAATPVPLRSFPVLLR